MPYRLAVLCACGVNIHLYECVSLLVPVCSVCVANSMSSVSNL